MPDIRYLNGYRVIYDPKNPSSMKNKNWEGYIYEHRQVVEHHLGRQLLPNEVVHHLDGNRENNRIENLLVLDNKQHNKLHAWLQKGAPGIERTGMNGVNSGNSKAEEHHNLPCQNCGKTLQHKQTKFCSLECQKNFKRARWPTKEELKADIETLTWLAIGRKYKVSDNAVRKWARHYGLL